MGTYRAMKAVLTDRPVCDPGWVFERKLDGIRCGALRRGSSVQLLSRSGQDLNGRFPEIVSALAASSSDLLLDGEVVAFAGGQTSFERLQQRGHRRVAVYYYVFDLLELDGEDLRLRPLNERKAALRGAIRFGGRIRFTPYRHGDAAALLHEACAHGWEGLIAKRLESPYVATRSRDWLKLKCSRSQELVIGGWTPPQGSRERLGALLVGYWEDGKLRYAGKVGTGFDHAMLERLGDELERRERPTPPFAGAVRALPVRAHWAQPELVAQVAFTEWTRDGKLRHPRFQGLRDDKPAREVVREEPAR